MIVIPFAVFFACTLAQFYFLRRVRQDLVARHPQIWLEISARTLFTNGAGLGFALKRGDRGLGDAELSRHVDHLMIVWAIAVGAWVVLFGMLVTGVGVPGR